MKIFAKGYAIVLLAVDESRQCSQIASLLLFMGESCNSIQNIAKILYALRRDIVVSNSATSNSGMADDALNYVANPKKNPSRAKGFEIVSILFHGEIHYIEVIASLRSFLCYTKRGVESGHKF